MLYNLKNWPLSTLVESVYMIKRKIAKNRKKDIYFIACYPRSASNYLTDMMGKIIKVPEKNIKLFPGVYHDFIYFPKLIDILNENVIITQHLRLTSFNRKIVTELKIKPVVLVRNIFDVIVSYDDYINKNGFGPLDPDQGDLAPELCKNYFELKKNEQYDYLIDFIVPWYISFFVTWYYYTRIKNEIKAYWLTYEDFTKNTCLKLNEIFKFYNINVPIDKINFTVNAEGKKNFNKGIIGRGKILTARQIERIYNFKSYHKNIDFTMIGL